MSRLPSIAVSTGLIGVGVTAWALTARPLVANADLNAPLNPLGINRSPYGEVFAMAMQTPVDTYFHQAIEVSGTEDDNERDASKSATNAPLAQPTNAHPSLTSRLKDVLTYLDKVAEIRTNPTPPSPALRLYLRRQTEDKLRFAYQLDPAHYANYNSLHFFLTEPELGTRPQLTASAAKLADDTIQYCLNQNNDPRPLLTAAGACTNILQLMFSDQHNPEPKFNPSQMRSYLTLLNHCLDRYAMLAHEWNESNQWKQLSPQRVSECEERYSFICKIRDASAKTIVRLETKTFPPPISN